MYFPSNFNLLSTTLIQPNNYHSTEYSILNMYKLFTFYYFPESVFKLPQETVNVITGKTMVDQYSMNM